MSVRHGTGRRHGFSLLELITAMVASTVLLASLAATVMIATQLLEVPPDDATLWHDRSIVDRLETDLRYATNIDENHLYGFAITKPNATSGSPESVLYQSYIDGLTRQVSSGPAIKLDPEAPTQQFYVDGYSAPTYTPRGKYARVRTSSTAATDTAVANLNLNIPPGCKAGDLVLLCVSAKTPDTLEVSQSGWQTLSGIGAGDLRMIALARMYDPSWPDTIGVTASPDSAMAAAMVVIEEVDSTSPISWTGVRGGFAWSFLSVTHPTPHEPSNLGDLQLNVQMFAADLDPWTDGALGIAGFTDVVQATAAAGSSSIGNTVGVAVRNGPTPNLTTTSRLRHQLSGYWLQTAVRVEAQP